MAARRGRQKRRGRHGTLTLALFILCMTLAVVAALLYGKMQDEARESASAQEQLARIESEIAQGKYYDGETVQRLLAEAHSDAYAAGVDDTRQSLRVQVEAPGAVLSEVIRQFYPEYVYYYGPEGHVFIPINESLPGNGIAPEDIVMSEDGMASYVVDGETRSGMLIDVSQFQGEIDWRQVADYGVGKVMVRTGFRGYGSGKLVEDERFVENIEGALEAGLEVGAYFFTQAITVEEAHEEAQMMLEQLAPYQAWVTLPVAIDVERITTDAARTDALPRSERTGIVRAFLEDVRAAGYEPMLYGNTQGLFGLLDIEEVYDYPIWYAFYDDYIYYPYPLRIWQYSEKGQVPGISGKVDLNLWLE